MSIDRSLRGASTLGRHRNVLNRVERLEKLHEEEKWDQAKSVYGLPKVEHRKQVIAKKEAAATVEGEAAAATPGATPAAGAPAAAGAKPAAGAAKAAAPAGKAAAPAAKPAKK